MNNINFDGSIELGKLNPQFSDILVKLIAGYALGHEAIVIFLNHNLYILYKTIFVMNFSESYNMLFGIPIQSSNCDQTFIRWELKNSIEEVKHAINSGNLKENIIRIGAGKIAYINVAMGVIHALYSSNEPVVWNTDPNDPRILTYLDVPIHSDGEDNTIGIYLKDEEHGKRSGEEQARSEGC